MSLSNRSVVIGSYDAQTGDEVVTFRKQRLAARLVTVRRALLWAPLLLVSAGCGATAHVASSTRPPSDAPSCRSGLVRAEDTGSAVTLDFAGSRVRVSDGERESPSIRILGDEDAILALTRMPCERLPAECGRRPAVRCSSASSGAS